MSHNQRRWSRFGLLFLASVLVYALIIFLAWILGAVVVKEFPENYEWQIKTALKARNLQKAENVARKRVEAEHYDFQAHRLLAQVLIEEKKTSEAVSVLLMSLDRLNASEGRNVYTRGADPAATYNLLSEALAIEGRMAFARETARIAGDYKAITLLNKASDSAVSKSSGSHKSDSASSRPLDLEAFAMSGGVHRTTSNTLYFSGNGKATAVFSAQESSPDYLALEVRGSKALGLGSILCVLQGGLELIRVYADSNDPRWVTVPLHKYNPNSSLQLTLEFINDGFDSVTRSDRNVELLQLVTY